MSGRDHFAGPRMAMVERQLRRRGIQDERVLAAFARVPREEFIPAELAEQAYADGPLPIGHGQTISEPYIVALMIEAAEVSDADTVLEVGAGSGFAAAILGRVARSLIAIERIPELAREAADRLARLAFHNVQVIEGDGTLGWPLGAPYDATLAAAGGPDIPHSLIEQLAPGGRLVMPVGALNGVQQLIKVTRRATGGIHREDLAAVRFVPLIGEEGWTHG